MKKIKFFCLILAGLISCSCLQEEEMPETRPSVSPDGKITVNFCLKKTSRMPDTKSSLAILDESAIHDLLLMAYAHGKLIDYIQIRNPLEHPELLQLSLQENTVHHLYAVANGFKIDPPADEAEMKGMLSRKLVSIQDLEEGLPMSWERICEPDATGADIPVQISLRRLASKVVLSMNLEQMKGFCCDQVRLRQVPSAIYPFRQPEGCKAISREEVMDGDAAGTEEGLQLTHGQALTFYTLENRQGILIQNNSDPWKKVPDEMTGAQDRCTYIEIIGHYEEPSIHRGQVTLRFYLGRNAMDDFNVDGNAVHYLNIIGSDKNLGKPSWKIEAETSIDPNKCKAWFAEDCMHKDGTLYIGEHFKTEFSMDPELEKYFGSEMSRMKVVFVPDTEDGQTPAISFSYIMHPKDYEVIGTCTRTSEGSFWLCRYNGERVLPLLEGIRIIPPEIACRQGQEAVCKVNTDLTLNFIFTDIDGKDLSTNPHGFSPQYLQLQIDDTALPEGYFTVKTGGPRFSWKVSCPNTGTEHERNLKLAQWISGKESFPFRAYETNTDKEQVVDIRLSHEVIQLTYQAKQDGIQLVVRNSSRIPLNIVDDVMFHTTMLKTEDYYKRTATLPHYEQYVKQQRYDFLLKYYELTNDGVYGCEHTVLSGLEEGCSPHVSTGNGLKYFYETPDCEDLNAAIYYNYDTPGYSKFVVDATLMGYPIEKYKIKVIADYGYQEWWSNGYILFSNNEYRGMDGSYLNPIFKPIDIQKEKNAAKVLDLQCEYDPQTEQLLVKTSEPMEDALVDIRIQGHISGTVNTIEGDRPMERDHFEEFNNEMTGIALSTEGLAVDGGQLAAAWQRMDHMTYPSESAGGTVQLAVSPTAIRWNLWIRLSQSTVRSCLKAKINVRPEQFEHHRKTDDKIFVIENSVKINQNKFYDVTRKQQ